MRVYRARPMRPLRGSACGPRSTARDRSSCGYVPISASLTFASWNRIGEWLDMLRDFDAGRGGQRRSNSYFANVPHSRSAVLIVNPDAGDESTSGNSSSQCRRWREGEDPSRFCWSLPHRFEAALSAWRESESSCRPCALPCAADACWSSSVVHGSDNICRAARRLRSAGRKGLRLGLGRCGRRLRP